jgi:hypothetical protein
MILKLELKARCAVVQAEHARGGLLSSPPAVNLHFDDDRYQSATIMNDYYQTSQ